MGLGGTALMVVEEKLAFDVAANGGFGVIRDPRRGRDPDDRILGAMLAALANTSQAQPIPARIYIRSGSVVMRAQGQVARVERESDGGHTVWFADHQFVELDRHGDIPLAVWL